MAEPLYVVTGATGHVGSVVARLLLEQRKRVRAIARNRDRLRPLVDAGAESAPGSLEDAAFVRKTFEGATAAFAMIPPNFQVKGFRAYQNRIAEALASAAESAGLTHVVTMSSVGADLSEGTGPIIGLRDMEERFNRVRNVSVLHLRPTYFMENHLTAIPMIKSMGVMGGALKADLGFPMIASRDIGMVAARRLAALDFSGKQVLELLGPRDVSMSEVARVFGATIGKPDLRYVEVSYADAQRGLVQAGVPEEIAALYMEMARGFNEGRIRPTQPRSPQTNTPTTLEEFASTFAQAFRAS